MRIDRILSIDGNSRPTWSLVVLLILTLSFEVVADFIFGGEISEHQDPYDPGECSDICYGYIHSVGPGTCICLDYLNITPEDGATK